MGAMETRAVEKPVFVEQAEYIEPARFAELNTEHPDEETILAKLSQAGAKLLTGPRGAGKTTLLLKAYARPTVNIVPCLCELQVIAQT
jgi:predicted AAA+ superfamily ATPase